MNIRFKRCAGENTNVRLYMYIMDQHAVSVSVSTYKIVSSIAHHKIAINKS